MNELVIVGLAVIVVGLVVALVVIASRRTRSGDLTDAIGTIHRRLEQLETLSNDVAELSRIFLVPRTRGGVGETMLAQLLANWLPESAFSLQYGFASGGRVDAVIHLGASLVPIDAKFPLESVRRGMADPADALPTDVKQAVRSHAQSIASRYIQPAEGTMEFALMYLPSERVYHYLFVEHESDGLYRELIDRRIVAVSPGNLFLYLTTVAYGLRGLAIPERFREMMDLIRQVKVDFAGLEQGIGVLNTHVRNAAKALEGVRSHSVRVGERIARLEEGR